MNSYYWGALGLQRARLADIERVCGPFDPDVQPHNISVQVVSPEQEIQKTRQLVEQLRAQEPVDRIINALLFSAIKESARLMVIEPDALGVRVFHTVGDSEREHLHLPTTTLEPMVERWRHMAKIPVQSRQGSFQIEIEARQFIVHVVLEHTVWGERIEVAFAAVPNAAA